MDFLDYRGLGFKECKIWVGGCTLVFNNDFNSSIGITIVSDWQFGNYLNLSSLSWIILLLNLCDFAP